MQRKILLPNTSMAYQTMGSWMCRLNPQQTQYYQTNTTPNDRHIRASDEPRRRPRNRHFTKPTPSSSKHQHPNSNRRLLALPLRLPNTKMWRRNSRQMPRWHHDATCLPAIIITDKGTQFGAQTTTEITKILGITLSHATTKHAQTIGILERAHGSLKTDIKIQVHEKKSFWHRYVQIAVMNYNTTYHRAIGCEPTKVFHGRTPYNLLDLKMGLKPTNNKKPEMDIASNVDKQVNEIYDETHKHLMQSYLKYKQYYDKKAIASKLAINDYCYVLNPTLDDQSQKVPFKQYIWDGPSIVVRVLSNNNYTVWRIGTWHTQTLHRIRLRRYTSEKTIPDVKCRSDQWRPDPKTLITHNDKYA